MFKAAIFDYSWTLFEVETDNLYPGATDLLNFLKSQQIKLAVVSRAEDVEKRKLDFQKFNFENYFDILDIVPKGSTKVFEHILNNFKIKSDECLIIGDRVKSEILEGNKIGATTIWIKQGILKMNDLNYQKKLQIIL